MFIFIFSLIILLVSALSFILVPLRGKVNFKFISILALSFSIVAIAGYFMWGNPKAVTSVLQSQQSQEKFTQLMEELKTPQQVIEKLQETMQDNPNDPRGWFLLGRLYMDTREFTKARDAFAKADALDPNNPQIMLEYAQVLFVLNKNKLNPQTNALLQKIVAQQPDNPGVISLLALNAYSQGNYQQAIDYWQQLLATSPPDSESAMVLRAAIEDAKEKVRAKAQ